MKRLALPLAALAIVGLRLATRARIPDDYDAVGFVRAVAQYDLAQFQPHFPGYPVYVALTRLLHGCGLDALWATTATSALASAATALALWRLGSAHRRRAGRLHRVGAVGGRARPDLDRRRRAVRRDGDGARGLVLRGADVARPPRHLRRRRAVGADAGRARFLLAARIVSFAFVVVIARRSRFFAAAGAFAGLVVWAVPFVLVVGAQPLWQLGRTHVTGHFTVWGGSIVTQPDVAARLFSWARDLVYDGIWPHPLALFVALVAAAMIARRPSRRALGIALAVVAPYAIWVLFGQNVLEQPRHLLPLVAALILMLALATQSRLPAAVALIVASAAASLPLAIARARVAPASARAAAWVASVEPQGSHALVYGMRATRLMQWAQPTLIVHPRQSFAEIEGDLARLDVLPHAVWVTSEVTGTPLHGRPLVAGPTFCRDARLDRQLPCVTVRQYTVRSDR
jgi:hypothetical protein